MPDNIQPPLNYETGSTWQPLAEARELFDKIQKPLKKVAENVFSEIEKIHVLPQLSKIDLMLVNADSFDGEFEYYKMGRGIRIKINSRAENKEFALLHEIGHFIDNQAFGLKGRNESEVPDGALSEVSKAINETTSIKKLTQMQKTGKYELMGKMRNMIKKDLEDVSYFLRPQEQWARAYSQYITVKSRNQLFAKQLIWQIMSDEKFPVQWQKNDFENVIFAIDNLFLNLKWSKQV